MKHTCVALASGGAHGKDLRRRLPVVQLLVQGHAGQANAVRLLLAEGLGAGAGGARGACVPGHGAAVQPPAAVSVSCCALRCGFSVILPWPLRFFCRVLLSTERVQQSKCAAQLCQRVRAGTARVWELARILASGASENVAARLQHASGDEGGPGAARRAGFTSICTKDL